MILTLRVIVAQCPVDKNYYIYVLGKKYGEMIMLVI